MKKLLQFLDDKFLKFGVVFAIAFTALYPKLPSIHINHTWVYIRLEDFVIAVLAGIWFIQLLRKKAKVPLPVSLPIFLYWLAGLCTLIYSFIFVGPYIANFFPSVAALQYVRRIEYMILFFVAVSTIRSEKDIKDYLKILLITISGVVLYGFGQRWYILLWNQFPQFFEKLPFCFPSFQTGNEEFAKGIPLCLPSDARITSTFGGHYDLAAYLVMVLPVLFGVFLLAKKIVSKVLILVITIGSAILLILTASRISFIAYLIGITAMLFFIKQKKWITPVIIVSIILLFLFSASTAKRFLETIRVASVVTDTQGQVVGVTAQSLPDALQKKISKNPVIVEAPPPSQNLPTGSGFITLPQTAQKTNTAVVTKKVSDNKVKELNLTYGGQEISTISGTFLVQKALVYDISFTTRFQGEWPNAWRAFLRNPLVGSGFATITLASDSDYFRILGESGLLGLLTFSLIFMFFGTLLKRVGNTAPTITKYFAFGLAGGILGLFVNATFIDVFEASKVAEPLWIFSGIAIGGLLLVQKEKINYLAAMKRIFTSTPLIYLYLTIILGVVFFGSLSNFFVADDFTWLKWAGDSRQGDLVRYFTDAQGFFYRPLDKLFIFVLFSFSAFKPEGYHLVMLFIHLIITFATYSLLRFIFQKKFWAAMGAVLFLVSPAHGETAYWISTVSNLLSSLWMILGINVWIHFRKKGSILGYLSSIVFAILALLSYEMAVIYPVLLLVTDLFYFRKRSIGKYLLQYSPFILLLPIYGYIRYLTHTVAVGGDYSYNLAKLLPNAIGNFLGYIGLFLAGESILPWYASIRMILRVYWLPITFLLLVIVGGIIIWLLRKKISISSNTRPIWYGLIFGFVSLSPFLGLGNMAGRYDYFATIGFTITLISGLYLLTTVFQKMKYIKGNIIGGVIVVILALVYATNIRAQSSEWQQAGNITYSTLTILKNKYDFIHVDDKLGFVNVPIKYHNAWVFPTGVNDAIWFIFRDSTPEIFQQPTIDEAKDYSSKKYVNKVYLFSFDKNGKLYRVE